MTIVTNTQTRYDVVNIREDLSDIIYNISPTDMIGCAKPPPLP